MCLYSSVIFEFGILKCLSTNAYANEFMEEEGIILSNAEGIRRGFQAVL